MNRITVQPAGPDRRVPIEGRKNAYFEQGQPREVYHTRYIARRIADGCLVEVTAEATAAAALVAPEGEH